jgi:hypothetical protein
VLSQQFCVWVNAAMRSTNFMCLGIVIGGVFTVVQGQQGQAQQIQGQQQVAQPPHFRAVKAVSGSKGEEQGNDFVIADPRSKFIYPQDKQVIVSFEWEGPLGTHKFQGTWRSPDGEVSSVSSFDREAKVLPLRAHWTLALPENVIPGLWELEAQIDGQPAGVYAFRVEVEKVSAPRDTSLEGEIYMRTFSGMVFVESVDNAGVRLNRGSGFFINPNLVLTAFENIEGAGALKIELPGGGEQRLTEVAGWNRSAGWALLQVNAPGAKELATAKAGMKIGETDYLLDAPREGGRTVHPVEIVAVRNTPGTSRRIYISWMGDMQSVGSPLLDRQGQVVGLLGGEPVAGFESHNARKAFVGQIAGVPGTRASMLVVPISEVQPIPPQAKPVTLAAMGEQGLFASPVTQDTLVITGSLCAEFQVDPKSGPVCNGIGGEISRKKQALTLWMAWSFEKDQKIVEESRVYDVENHRMGEPIVKELKLKRGGPNLSDSKISIASLQPGIYRVDVLVSEKVHWRMNFIVTE